MIDIISFPLSSLCKDKVLFRNKDNEFVLDLNLLKENYLLLHEEFLYNPKEFINLTKEKLFEAFRIKNFRIINFMYLQPISHLRTEHLEKIVRVRGMITKTTKVIALVKTTNWECLVCGAKISRDNHKKPSMCSCGNRGRFLLSSSVLQDIQEIEIEEIQDELGDKQPQKIRVRLLDELTDKSLSGILQPGSKIEVLGIVQKLDKYKPNKIEEIFEYKVLAVDLKSLEEKYNEEKVEEEDLKEIVKLSEDNPLEKLSHSLAPSIYGNDVVKKSIILQMVGGVKKKRVGGVFSRDRIHLLLVGDPGTAKSILTKNVNLRMPKSYYVSGEESSKAGLIAIVDRDSLTQEWCLRAGALSKANDSLLIIDELDKMSDDDRNALHTPMESGEIVVNKANIHTSLTANCSILAIANPKEGLFDLSGDKTLPQQINLPPPLLSRFDLIFLMIDKIDEESDMMIAKKIYSSEDNEDSYIPIKLFRKYITYCRKLKPKLLEENLVDLSSFYHEIRKKSVSEISKMRGMPITPRHLEGMIRLAEASAKIRLSKVVEKEDLELAKTIFYDSLIKLGMDKESGIIDLSRISQKIPISKRGKVERVLEIINKLSEEIGPLIPYSKIIKESEKFEIKKFELNNYLEQLKQDKQIFEPEAGVFKLL